MALVTRHRGEPVENGDVLNCIAGKAWRYRYTAPATPQIPSPRLCVEPVKGGQARFMSADDFPHLTVGAA